VETGIAPSFLTAYQLLGACKRSVSIGRVFLGPRVPAATQACAPSALVQFWQLATTKRELKPASVYCSRIVSQAAARI